MLILDDLNWTCGKSPTLRNTQAVQEMPQKEKLTPQVRKVYELLIKPHPAYGEFLKKDGWAYARKVSTAPSVVMNEVRREKVHEVRYVGFAVLQQARDCRAMDQEGKQAAHWTRLSCHRFRANEVRLQLSVLAYNLGNLWQRLVLPVSFPPR